MANVFSRSWQITKMSFGVIKKDKELLLFPILSAITSTIFMIALLFPSIIIKYVNATNPEAVEWEVIYYIYIFITYLGLAFISTFFNVCVVYTTKKRFEGGNAKFFESIGYAFKNIHLIFLWSMVSATVGLLLSLLEQLGRNLGQAGQIVIGILRGILSMAWTVVTLFVIPVMVYEGLTPFKAIKRSTQTLGKTWGESIVRGITMGIIQFLFILLGILGGAGIGYILYSMEVGIGAWIGLIVGVIIYFILLNLIFSTATKVYNTALYVYATKGKIPSGFNKSVLKDGFKESKKF